MPTARTLDEPDPEYDTESVIAMLQMCVSEYGDMPLDRAYALIDWRAVRLHGETREQYQSRMIELGANI